MQYLMFICTVDDFPADVDLDEPTRKWVEEMDGRGVRLHGNRLRPVADSTTVRVRGGEVLLTDGPFAESTEHIAGFDLIECADLDEAIEIASKHPMAAYAGVEVRPLWPLD
jgi:hypothetical protein